MAPDHDEGAEQSETFDSFSAKWDRISSDEVKQRFVKQYAWYLDRYGFDDEEALGAFISEKGPVLDAGTGTGGDAARFARLTEAPVVAFDLSVGIDVAKREFGGPGNLHFVQGDILRPPFKKGVFGFVSSDQVIHHTPDAPRAFATLASLLTDGGAIAVYVYKVKALMRELADDHVREITTQMSDEECMEFSRAMSELGRELSAVDAKVTISKDIPVLGIEAGEHDVQRLVYWHFLKAFWNDDFSENLNDLVNFDWYSPPYASRHTPEEVEAWCGESGLGVDRLDVVESGISVLASRA